MSTLFADALSFATAQHAAGLTHFFDADGQPVATLAEDWRVADFAAQSWYLIEVTKDIKTKLGLAARKGDRLIAHDHAGIPGFIGGTWCERIPSLVLWSVRNRCETHVNPKHVRRLR